MPAKPNLRQVARVGAGLFLGLAAGLALIYGFPEREPAIPAETAESTPEKVEGTFVGALAPDFVLLDLDGAPQRLSDYRGQVILLNFWATWCAPCRLEMPEFQSRYERFSKEGFVVLAVNFDESESVVRAFRDELDLSFPLLLDPGGEIQRRYNVFSYPTSVFVDRQGVIKIIHIGYLVESQLDVYFQQMGLMP